MNRHLNIKYFESCFVFFLIIFVSIAAATDHHRPVLEPYQLAGKRIVFTNWYFVRPGHFDWVDDQGKSVYASPTAKLDEREAHFIAFDSPHGIRLIIELAKREIPIIATNKPWDRWGIRLATLIYENGTYRLWGTCNFDNEHQRNCYFESTDGIHWEKPNLGLVQFDGSKENNLLSTRVGLSVFIDPVAPQAERYKTMWHSKITRQQFEKYKHTRPWSVMATELDAPLIHVVKGAVSADGFHWTELADPIAIEHSDTQNICYYDKKLQSYVLCTRSHMVGSRAPGVPYPQQKFHQRIVRRAVGRTESKDFRQFPLSRVILETGPDMHPSDQFYTNCYTTIPGAPDSHLMFPAIYNVADDETKILLYSSYDGKVWHRVQGAPVLETQPFGEPDGGCVFAHPNLVERPNGDWVLPYSGYNVPHKYPRGAYRFEPGLLVWGKGRLVAIEAKEIGEFATVAFLLPGRKLKVNALTQRAGYIKIEAVAFDGKPISGYTFDESDEIIGNQFWKTVTWRGKQELGVKIGTPIWFRFKMKMAKIYGLEFE